MAKLYFHYAAMNAGKSTMLLQAAHNYRERAQDVILLMPAISKRDGTGLISSRIGIAHPAIIFTQSDNIQAMILSHLKGQKVACIFVDEAQFLTEAQVWQLTHLVDQQNIPAMCYGLRTDFQGNLFPGSRALLSIADELREIRTICWCGRKAIMVARFDAKGNMIREGSQVAIGGEEMYVSLCRRHWQLGKLSACKA